MLNSEDAKKLVLVSPPFFDEEEFHRSISGLSNPHHECFEISALHQATAQGCTFLSRVAGDYTGMP